MPDEERWTHPWMVAVWPGMGNVALSAGYYLMAKLGMELKLELAAEDLFEIEHVEVKGGLIRTGRRPFNRFFAWKDPRGERDLIVFIGEEQPPRGKFAFCRGLIEYAQRLGVERVFTFAAMATQMSPSDNSRIFGAATDEETLAELKTLELEILEDGHIGGLNGLLLGAAADKGLRGACLLGEMPHILAQLPFPKASLAVLELFRSMAGMELDLSELAQQAKEVEQKLGQLLAQVEERFGSRSSDEEDVVENDPEEDRTNSEDRERIETLFDQARKDRSFAYELKRELDRLELYHDYEDRFLDLFRKSDEAKP